MLTPTRPRVSVILITYNHQDYVAQALDHVLLQQTPFEFEILVSEDCSTDATRSILREYASREPRLRLLLSESNLNSNLVTSRALRAARGEYIALLDGDDYWTASDKLRLQVEYLDAHRECALCFHDATVVYSDNSTPDHTFVPDEYRRVTTFRDLVQRNYIPGCAPLIRRAAVKALPAWYDAADFGDWPLYLIAAQHGDIGYVDAVLGVYRRHAGGFWSGRSARDQYAAMAKFLHSLEPHFAGEYQRDIRAASALHCVSAETAPAGRAKPKSVSAAPAPKPKQWAWDAASVPWFERANSTELLEERRKAEALSDADLGLLRHWLAFGFSVVKGVVPVDDIDEMQRDVDALWTTDVPRHNLGLIGLRLHANSEESNLTHAQLTRLHTATRHQIRARSNYRIHGMYSHSAATERVFRNAELARIASLVLGKSALPSYTINFTRANEHGLQQDTAVFHIVPPNHVVGVWLACEDVHPDSGPLVIYPGSHRSPMYAGFTNYPQTNLRTLSNPADYGEFVREQSRNYDPLLFLAKKGDALLWHGMLIHGGSSAKDRTRTRRSYVCHYIPPGMDVAGQVEGPFNW